MAIDKYKRMSATDMTKLTRTVICSTIEAKEYKSKDAKEKFAKYGTKKYLKVGLNDRISALPPKIPLYNENRTGDEQSYYYGYYERGNEKIATLIKYPEIKRIATIEEIGYNDAVSGIAFNLLPEAIQSSKEYLEGYKKGLEELKTNKKTR